MTERFKVDDLVEQVHDYHDGAPDMPIGSVGIVTNWMGGSWYRIQWVTNQPDRMDNNGVQWMWHHERFKRITDGK